MKVCTKCKCELPESEFPKYKLGRGGLFPQCIVCKRAGHQAMREKVKERERKQAEFEKSIRTLAALEARGVALPKSVEPKPWVPLEEGYVRNDGLKHIKSKGV